GNLLACRAGLAVIEFMEVNDVLKHVGELGSWALAELQTRTENLPRVKEIRGLGLMLAIELNTAAGPYLKSLLGKGILALSAGKKNIRLLPPLTITKTEMAEGIDTLVEVLG
ncbi:MAG TPA: aminotransferase class III-fold pyridoxal phosphate-dependent enzyme, partial [Candidatus Marinimicrobia bacterium]|nr:aminotransferase class III-fold pyridoxal phosphate-dependent enzyme [Candidatus Neomarinimicrobiota bacterium]